MAKSPSELMLIYNSAIFFCKNALSLLSSEPQKSDLPGQEIILCGFELKFHQEIVCFALQKCNKLLLKPVQLSSNLSSVRKKWLIVCPATNLHQSLASAPIQGGKFVSPSQALSSALTIHRMMFAIIRDQNWLGWNSSYRFSLLNSIHNFNCTFKTLKSNLFVLSCGL